MPATHRNSRPRRPRELLGICLLLVVSMTSRAAVWLDGTLAGANQSRDTQSDRTDPGPRDGNDAR